MQATAAAPPGTSPGLATRTPASGAPPIPPRAWPTTPPLPPAVGDRLHRTIAYLRARPILVLLLMSPGLPEYLSGSSPLNAIVLNPGWFVLQLALNLGLYGPGVLLIREASVRWKTGIIPVLLLGAAYGILEEGIALSTLFNPSASVVGGLGTYGHFQGVNTVWVPGVLMVHMVFSIGLPIFLLGMALPETRGVRFLTRRGIAAAFTILGLDVLALLLAITIGAHFWMGWPLFVGSFGAIGALLLAAYRWPAETVSPPRAPAGGGLWAPAVLGAMLFVGVIFAQGIGEALAAPAALTLATVLAVEVGVGLLAYRTLRGAGNVRRQLAFALGLLAPIMVFGFLAQYRLDLVLLADALLVVWFYRLLHAYGRAGASSGPSGVARTAAGPEPA